ncbi:MAG: hypothetical protein HC907_17835 [Richelia sp. SM1_7_0]|nr:hypothetical protein [Richelia sp. SM1_7_0]
MKGQLSEVKDYLNRVKNAGGTVRKNVQLELNIFTKKLYQLNLRDTLNVDHKIQHCAIYCTESKNGTDQNLWYLDGKKTHYKQTSDNSYTYTENKGVNLKDTLKIDTDIRGNLFSSGNCSIGLYQTLMGESTGEIGAKSTDASIRFFIHPQYTGTRGIYFDVGNFLTSGGRSFGAIPDNKRDNRGLTICTKNGGTGIIELRNQRIATNTNLTDSLPMPSEYFIINPGYNNNEYLSLGGYWIGKNIEESKFTGLTQAWDNLQNSISPERLPTFLEVPSPKLWFDSTDATTMLTTSGSQVADQGFVRTWNDKSSTANPIQTDSASFTVQYIQSFQGLRFLKATNASGFKRTNGFFIGTIAIVFTPLNTHNFNSAGSSGIQGLLGFNNGAENGFVGLTLGGNKTSNLDNEVLSLMGDGRIGLQSTTFSFNANTKYALIISRTGNRTGLIKVNSNYQNVQVSNTGANFSFYNNVAFVLGNNNNLATNPASSEKFNGYIHEFRNYYEEFSTQEIDKLMNELLVKHGI